MALTAVTSSGKGVTGGMAGALIGGLSATGIGLVIAAPIAVILGSASFIWTRKGMAKDYANFIMGRREGLKEKVKNILNEHFNYVSSLFEKYVDSKFA